MVKNQGSVPSGPFTFHDVLPAGLTFVSASNGGVGVGQEVTWTARLDPGEVLTVSLVATIAAWHGRVANLAEIEADSSAAYGTHDVDSTPDADLTNDRLVDTDDINANLPGDEDDHDRAIVELGQLVVTGSAPWSLVWLASGCVVLGVMLRRTRLCHTSRHG